MMKGTIEEIIERIKELYNLETDGEVAKQIGMKHPAMAMHKKRGTIPLRVLRNFCEREKIRLNWLLTGKGERIRKTFILKDIRGGTGTGKIQYEDSKFTRLNILFQGIREYRRIKQEDIALHVGITKQAISGFEKGEITLSQNTLEKIAVFLGFKTNIVQKFLVEDIETITDFLEEGIYHLYCDEDDSNIIPLIITLGFDIIWVENKGITDTLVLGIGNATYCIFVSKKTISILHRKAKGIHIKRGKGTIYGVLLRGEKGEWTMEEKKINEDKLTKFVKDKKVSELISLLTL